MIDQEEDDRAGRETVSLTETAHSLFGQFWPEPPDHHQNIRSDDWFGIQRSLASICSLRSPNADRRSKRQDSDPITLDTFYIYQPPTAFEHDIKGCAILPGSKAAGFTVAPWTLKEHRNIHLLGQILQYRHVLHGSKEIVKRPTSLLEFYDVFYVYRVESEALSRFDRISPCELPVSATKPVFHTSDRTSRTSS